MKELTTLDFMLMADKEELFNFMGKFRSQKRLGITWSPVDIVNGLAEVEKVFEADRKRQEEKMKNEYDPSNGSPFDRGSADAYYGRPKKPHKYPKGSYIGLAVYDLTPEEVEAYNAGYAQQTGLKIWD